ncbi:MAG: hypothetical protein MK101_00150 [Phycisphaerales bacterium]|nr:hypothetical protein [Phycisphaerales bacterium]
MPKLRTRLALTLSCIVAGAAVTWWVMTDMAQQRIAALEAEQARMEAELAAFDEMLERLSRSRRLGRIEVLDQLVDEPTGEVLNTSVRFVELDDRGRSIGEQDIDLPGDVIHVDTQTIRFPHDQVAAGHPLRGNTLVLLRRIYSECIAPQDGVPLDVPGAVPPGYADAEGRTNEWEQGLWSSFWRLARDPDFARAAGVRVAQGEVVYQRMAPGQVWQLDVDAAGGITLMAAVD